MHLIHFRLQKLQIGYRFFSESVTDVMQCGRGLQQKVTEVTDYFT